MRHKRTTRAGTKMVETPQSTASSSVLQQESPNPEHFDRLPPRVIPNATPSTPSPYQAASKPSSVLSVAQLSSNNQDEGDIIRHRPTSDAVALQIQQEITKQEQLRNENLKLSIELAQLAQLLRISPEMIPSLFAEHHKKQGAAQTANENRDPEEPTKAAVDLRKKKSVKEVKSLSKPVKREVPSTASSMSQSVFRVNLASKPPLPPPPLQFHHWNPPEENEEKESHTEAHTVPQGGSSIPQTLKDKVSSVSPVRHPASPRTKRSDPFANQGGHKRAQSDVGPTVSYPLNALMSSQSTYNPQSQHHPTARPTFETRSQSPYHPAVPQTIETPSQSAIQVPMRYSFPPSSSQEQMRYYPHHTPVPIYREPKRDQHPPTGASVTPQTSAQNLSRRSHRLSLSSHEALPPANHNSIFYKPGHPSALYGSNGYLIPPTIHVLYPRREERAGVERRDGRPARESIGDEVSMGLRFPHQRSSS